MTELKIIIIIVSIFSIGISMIFSFNLLSKSSFFEKLGYAYGLGITAIVVQMLLYQLTRVEWNFWTLITPWMLLLVFSIKRFRISRRTVLQLTAFKDPKLVIPFTLIIVSVAFVTFESVLRPLLAWDGWAHWFLGGKSFYIEKSINPEYYRYANVSNPPVVNLLIAFFYFMLGTVEDRFILLIYPAFYISLLMVFYSNLRRVSTQKFTMWFTFLLASTHELIRHSGRFDAGNGDLPLAYFFFCSATLLLLFIRYKSLGYLILSNIFLGVGSLVKSEGLPFLIVSLLVTLFLVPEAKGVRKFFAHAVILPVGWYLFKAIHQLPESPFITGNIEAQRLPMILYYSFMEFINIQRWNLLWPLFFFLLFFYKSAKQVSIIVWIVLLQLGVYMLIYMMTPVDPVRHLLNTFDRLLLHVAPLALLFIAITISQLFERKKFYN